MTDSWRDRIVGARLTVDSTFADRVQQSSFSRQQWGLIMTAVEFEIEQPDDPDAAEMIANTDKLTQVLPELDTIEQQMNAMGGGGREGGSGFINGIKRALGLGSDASSVDGERESEAVQLTGEYATELQTYLESAGRWEEICELAAEE
jgi:hypothetical protein